MKINKDEARILAEALDHAKYDWFEELGLQSELANQLNEAIKFLQTKLENEQKDNRRRGRTTLDEWHDLLKRFAKKYGTINS